MASPTTLPTPLTRLSTPGGSSGASNWVSRVEVLGVSSDGLITTVLPAASAGRILLMYMTMGTFQAGIRPHTPMGSCTTLTSDSSGSTLAGRLVTKG